ncbi:MAG: permease [Erysipelotrichaceae bacterium]
MFQTIMYISATGLLIVSAFNDQKKTKLALKKAWKAFENMLPQFLGIIFLIGIVLSVIDPVFITRFIGKDSGLLGLVSALILGSITQIPAFVAFPLASNLLESGAGMMQIAGFVSTLMMVGIITIPMEASFWGKKATYLRNGLAFVFSIVVALVMGGLL